MAKHPSFAESKVSCHRGFVNRQGQQRRLPPKGPGIRHHRDQAQTGCPPHLPAAKEGRPCRILAALVLVRPLAAAKKTGWRRQQAPAADRPSSPWRLHHRPPIPFEEGDDSAALKAEPPDSGSCNAAAKPACPQSAPCSSTSPLSRLKLAVLASALPGPYPASIRSSLSPRNSLDEKPMTS